MTKEIVIGPGTELEKDTLFYPPDPELLGFRARDWPLNRLPVDIVDAIKQAGVTGQPLFHSLEWSYIKYRTEPQPYKAGKLATEGVRTSQGWLALNWQWVIPIFIGATLMVLRVR